MLKSAVVDIFCGAGGLTHGFVLEGFNVVAGVDFDMTCKYAFEKNNNSRFVHKDVQRVTGKEILDLYPKNATKILVGCAPCQPFSSYTNGKNKCGKWRLLYAFSNVVSEVQPDVISMENVPQLENYKNGSVFGDFLKNLKDEGYYVSHSVVRCQDYGVPQTRRRLVLFASKFGEIHIIEKTHALEGYVTVRDAIGGLEPIGAGKICPTDPLHRARGLSPLNMKRIRNTPYGGDWRDWKKDLRLKCHKKKSGKSFKRVYGRMVWEEPAPTITTQFVGIGNGRFGHPEQDRAISLREAALLQTFPPYYDFINPKAGFSGEAIAMHIGNAVPVQLGRVIAKSVKMHLEANHARDSRLYSDN